MANRCRICGKLLVKSTEEIGPVCMRKFRNRTIRRCFSTELKQPDMFAEENDGQKQDETTDECVEE